MEPVQVGHALQQHTAVLCSLAVSHGSPSWRTKPLLGGPRLLNGNAGARSIPLDDVSSATDANRHLHPSRVPLLLTSVRRLPEASRAQ